MYLLVTYDVSTIDTDGPRRLRRVAKKCLDFGQRVQNSVFECKVNPAEFTTLKLALLDIINPEQDSIRFYFLGTHWEKKIEHHGKNNNYNVDGPLIV